MAPTSQVYTNQTGRFITPSSNGNNYLLILYDYDSNAILAEPLKDRTGTTILAAGYQKLHAALSTAGLRPQLQRLNNECSIALKKSSKNPSTSNLFPLMFIIATPRNAPSALSRITSLQGSVARTKSFPCTCGIASCPKPC
jgi:hypothetical protein